MNKGIELCGIKLGDTFDENKVLYRQEIINGEEVYIYSNNPEDELFNVRFSLVGANQGDQAKTVG